EEMAQELVRQVKAGASLAEASRAMGLEHREFPAFTRINPPLLNPVLTGHAFSLPVGALSQPIVTDEGIYVIRILSRTPADSAAFEAGFNEFQSREIRGARDERIRFFLASLREAARIKDERSQVFRTNAQIEATTPQLPIQ